MSFWISDRKCHKSESKNDVNRIGLVRITFLFVANLLFLFVTTQRIPPGYCLDVGRQADRKLTRFESWCAFTVSILYFSYGQGK
jgi:hypothetical protein